VGCGTRADLPVRPAAPSECRVGRSTIPPREAAGGVRRGTGPSARAPGGWWVKRPTRYV